MASPGDTPADWSAQKLEDYMLSLLRSYAFHTQVCPAPADKLVTGFYRRIPDAGRVAKKLFLPKVGDAALDGIIQRCFEKGQYRLVVRDEKGNQSLVMGSQMPTADIPTGGVMDLPLGAYLRSKGVSAIFAGRVRNMLTRKLPRTLCMDLAVRRSHDTESMYRNSKMLTVGGLVAYLLEHPLEEFQYKYKVGSGTIKVLTEHVVNGVMAGMQQQ